MFGIFGLGIGICAGYLIAWLCKDELIEGRKYFRWIVIVGLLIGIYGLMFKSFVFGFIGIFISEIGMISYIKSGDKKWAVKRIR